MRYQGLIDDDECMRERKLLQAQLAFLKQGRGETENRAENWLELTEKTFDFTTNVIETNE